MGAVSVPMVAGVLGESSDSPSRVLVIDGSFDAGPALQRLLSVKGYDVVVTEEGIDGWVRFTEESYDLIVLDLQAVESNALDFCRRIKGKKPYVPLLLMSDASETPEVIRALEAGGSTYLVKPVNPFELAARTEALLRLKRDLEWGDRMFRFGDNLVDLQTFHVFRKGKFVDLSGVTLDLLKYFIQHQDMILSRERLLREVWSCLGTNVTRTVDMHVSKLRKKLERDARNPRHILTVQGQGYRFIK